MRYTTHGRRFLHALNLCREIAGLPDEPELLHGLRKHLFRSCERDDGFAWDDIGEDAVPALIQELKDQNEHVREEVADVLWQIGTADVLKAVEEYQSRQ
ncbi:TPA: HEAT repeat domain-containing protein [Candidatus Poribacteria bacterium]|nr:HEAT repeat domain-containing protein [Candidatus Poribacteria bacterium]HIB87011.1 HEAT repeat domain-containing protein [Candidatus Poribacteria bacterium]HIO81451.1 HEAT repeat domain-containing protein [Candidatus Poribacteria bacterium]